MKVLITSVTNPSWADAEGSAITCDITTSQFGDEILSFIASPNDPEAHGRAIFADLIAGEYGLIGEYVAPEPVVQPTTQGAQTL